KERYRTLQSKKQRFGESFPEMVLQFDSDTHKISLGETMEDAEIKRAKEAIISCLFQNKQPMRRESIAKAVGMRWEYVRQALKELHDEGIVLRTGKGVKGDSHFYKLKPLYPVHSGNKKTNQQFSA